jgi:tetratricopeptide (TPR) repeat protein
MTSEIERIAREIRKKPVAQIEAIAYEIQETCNKFARLNADVINSGDKLSSENSDKLVTIGEVLKSFRVHSAGLLAAWRLNEEQFEKRGLERDAYERRLTELTQSMTSLKFDFDKCILEFEVFKKQLIHILQREGRIVTQPTIGERAKVEPQASAANTGTDREGKPLASFSDPEAFIKIGLSYEQSNRPSKAKECFQSAVSFKPKDANVWFHLGRANSDLGIHSEAIKCYQKVLDIDPQHTGAICDLGFSYGQIGDHKKASKCFRKLIDINPHNSDAWIGLGTAQYSMGNLKQAKEFLEKARQINPQNALAWYNLGLVYSALGYQQESKRCYDEAEKLSLTHIA